MSDPAAEYARFVALSERARFARTCADLDLAEARALLGVSDRPGWFTHVGERIVPDTTVQAVGAVVSMLVSLLGIDRPEVLWFLPETDNQRAHRLEYGPDDLDQFQAPDTLHGRAIRTDPPAVWIHAGLPLRRAMQVAAHECRHLAQHRPDDVTGYVANERDAAAFDAAFATHYNLN